MPEFKVTIDFNVWCDACERNLNDKVVVTKGGDIHVKPCPDCLDAAYERGSNKLLPNTIS
jgi:hypothetical protein